MLKGLSYRNWKIHTKLVATLLALSWLPVAAVTYNYINTFSSAARAGVDRTITELGIGAARDIQATTALVINQAHDTLGALARQPALQAFLTAATPEEAFAIQTRVNTLLADALASQPNFRRVTLYGPDGVARASSDPRLFGFDASSREDVRSALQGLAITSRLKLGGADGSPGLFVSAPVLSNGRVVGVVSARIEVSFIYAAIEEIIRTSPQPDAAQMYRRSSRILLVNPEGVILGHHGADTGWLFRSLGELDDAALSVVQSENTLGRACPQSTAGCAAADMVSRLPEPLLVLQPVGDALRAAAPFGGDGTVRYCRMEALADLPPQNCRGASWNLAVFEPVRGPLRNNVLFFVMVDVAEAPFLEPARQQISTLIGLALLFGVLVILASFLIAELIAQPVRALAAVAGEVEMGQEVDPDVLTEISASADELGGLARVFSRMIVTVQARERELRQTVERLRVEIDHTRRKADVDEIAQGEFFKKLRAEKEERTRDRGERPTQPLETDKPEDT